MKKLMIGGTIAILMASTCLPTLQELPAEEWAKKAEERIQHDLNMLKRHHEGVYERLVAAEKDNDQATLADIAKNGENAFVRKMAAQRLNDQAALEEIVKNDKEDDWVLQEATLRITNPALLAEIAKRDKADSAPYQAVHRLRELNQELLIEIAKSEGSWLVRNRALSQITNEVVLADFAENDKDEKIRQTAKRKVDMLKAKKMQK